MMLEYLLARSGVEAAVSEKWPDFLRDFRGDLERVQKRRRFPTRVTQGFQVVMQDRVLLPYRRAGKASRAPRIPRLFNRLRFL